MNDCLLLILSFLTGWYVCNRYHDRDRLVEGSGEDIFATLVLIVISVILVFAFICNVFDGCSD